MICIRLAPAKGSAEFRRRQACMLFEGSRQVALIRETRVGSDGGQRQVRAGEFSGGKFDPQPAHIFSDGAAIEGPEDANQMDRMYLGYFSDFRETQFFRKGLV